MRARFGESLLRGLALVSALSAAGGEGICAMNRLWLASQHDWGAKKGFYLAFENTSEGDAPCRLASLKLILGVADGREWRFISAGPAWRFDKEYRVRAAVDREGARLWLDGSLAGSSPGGLAPAGGPLLAAHTPDWAKGPAEYMIMQSSLAVSSGAGQPLRATFEGSLAHPALRLFESGPGERFDWSIAAGSPLTIEAGFKIVKRPDPREFAPLVDRYGQSVHADWPGKIRRREDLAAAMADEERRLADDLAGVSGYDRFGGWTGARWRVRATGFYRLERRGEYWWLVTPEGNPCFFIGVCTAPALEWDRTPVTGREHLFEWLPPRDGLHAASWGRDCWGEGRGTDYVSIHTSTMIEKYGDDWQRKARESTARRLKAWGFSGIAKWGGQEGLPSTPVLGRWAVKNLVRHPDVFDEAVRREFREALRAQIEPRRRDPFVVGWSLGNEYDEIVTREEIGQILKMPAAVSAKRALVDRALDAIYGGDVGWMARAWGLAAGSREELHSAACSPSAADIEALRRFYAEEYYRFVYRTVKELDPDHLYLGFWIVPGWWENEEDWRLIVPHCDIVGYDQYAYEFGAGRALDLIKECGKPVLCGEFSFPAWYRGTRGYGFYPSSVDDDAASGEHYRRWVEAAARNPACVGVAWFQYRDQPLTGRGPGRGTDLVYGEHFAFGLVDITDRPKWDLVTRIRAANLNAAAWRLAASAGGPAKAGR